MKKTIFILFTLASLFGCNRNSDSADLTDSIVGTYRSYGSASPSDGIVNVSVVNATFIKIIYNRAPYDPKTEFIFDSVKLFNDKTFTVNQIFKAPINNGNVLIPSPVAGTGNFGTNTIHFDFTWTNYLGPNNIKFDGAR